MNLKNSCCALCLTDFYFHRKVCRQKNIWRNLTVSQYFRVVVKMAPKPGKNFGCYSKETAVVLISHCRAMLVVSFRRTNCNENSNSYIVRSLADSGNSLLKYIFLLNNPRTDLFYIVR